MSRSEIAAVLGELEDLPGGILQGVHHPRPFEIVLTLRVPGDTRFLLLSVDPGCSRIHLVGKKPSSPKKPSDFCMILRKFIKGARILGLHQVEGDRVLSISLAVRGDGKSGEWMLAVEMIGRKGGIYLVDPSGVISGALSGSGRPRLGPGDAYTPPPPPPPSSRSRERKEETAIKGPDGAPLNEGVAAFYEDLLASRHVEERSESANKAIRRTRKKLSRLESKLRDDLDETAGSDRFLRMGELVKMNLGLLSKGMESFACRDVLGDEDEQITIPLDPSLGPIENMEACFRKAKKLARAKTHHANRLDVCRADLALLDRLAAELSDVVDEEVLDEVETALGAKGWLDSRRPRRRTGGGAATSKRTGPGLTIPRGDYEIVVGRKDVDNDAITFRLAKGNDWWLHPLHVAGPHVLIRPGGQEQPPREVVMDAGQLALYFSKLKRSGKGDVMLTQRKYIQRAKGAKPGSVICRRYSTLFVKIDVDRVQELLGKQGTDHDLLL